MSNYANLKSAIQSVIKANGNNEITGQLLQTELLAMITTLGYGYQFMGIASPDTVPGTPDAKVFYIAYAPGTYTNFGGIAVTGLCVLKYATGWVKEDIPVSGGGGGTEFTVESTDLTLQSGNPAKLKFADRLRESNITTGKNYIILRETATFAQQVIVANCIYEIRYDFDLGGQTVTIPSGCVLRFNGGRISNGKIATPYTEVNLAVIHYNTEPYTYKKKKVYTYTCAIEGLTENCFYNLGFDGCFVVGFVSYKYFSGYATDTSLLSAIFELSLPGTFPCIVDLENRQYNVNSDITEYSASIFDFTNIANKIINGNGAIINDQRTRSFFDEANGYMAVIGLWESNNIIIRDIEYKNTNSDWPVGVVYDLNVTGAAFIHTFLDCDNINIDIKTYGARYGFIHGEYSMYWLCGENGLTNSKINVYSELTGYPAVVQIGENIDIWVHSETDHRSAYVMGVYNANIYIESKDHYCAPLPCLIGDFRYSGSFDTTKYRGFGNLEIKFVDLGTTVIQGQNSDGSTYDPDTHCVGFSYWLTGSNPRDFALTFKNVNVSVYIPKNSIISAFAFQRADPGTPIQDIFENFSFNVLDESTGGTLVSRISYSSQCIYKNIDFKMVVTGKQSTANTLYAVNLNADAIVLNDCSLTCGILVSGKIVMNNCAVGSVREITGETAFVIANNCDSAFSQGLTYVSGRFTALGKFPLTSEMSDKPRGMFILRSSNGFLVWNNGWFSIPLYPVNIANASLQTGTMANVGASNARPASPSSSQRGFPYFDITLKLPIWQEGYSWIEADGEVAGIKRSGTTSERPTPKNVGFRFFDTDLNKPIWYTGSGWVDATGTTV